MDARRHERGGGSATHESGDTFGPNYRIPIIAVVLLATCAGVAWRVADSRTFQIFGDIVNGVDTSAPVVALTFDDGPAPSVSDSILAILEREGVRATFFFTGSQLAGNADLAARFVAAGHEIGNHSYSHPRFLLRSPSFIRREIESTDSLVREAGYDGPIHFRPPYG